MTAALLVATACDDPEALAQAELADDSDVGAADELTATDADDEADAFAAELAAAHRFVERAAIVDHPICGEAKAPAAVDVEVLWGRSAGGVGRLRVDVDQAADAEVAVDVAVVVAGETVDQLRGVTILGPEALARATLSEAEGRAVRPYAVEAELDLRDTLAALEVDHGMLVVVAKLRRGDGTIAAADRPLYLFFERGEAGLELFDEAAGFARGLDRPALSLAAAVPEPGGEPADDAVGEGIFAAAATDPQALDLDVIPYVSIKLCARHSVTYTDAGLAGEDYWTTQTLARRMTGADARVYVSGQQIWSGKLGDGTSSDADGEGCTPYLWMPAGSNPAIFYDTDTGSINGNNLKVRVDGGGAPVTMIGFANLQTSGTYWGTGTHTSSVYPVYLAIAKAMRAHSGGDGGLTYYALTEHDNGSRYDRNSEEIRIAPGDENERFIVVHEYGHAFGDKVGDGHLVGGNCSKTSAGDDCSSAAATG